MSVPANNSRIAFGLYEVDLRSEEIWKAGFRVKLQSQPFKVLVALLEHPGQVVTREELRTRLWGSDTVGNFEQSLGSAINKIREALGDSAENPRFVETLSRRGYRFIAPVSVLAPELPTEPEPVVTLAPPVATPAPEPSTAIAAPAALVVPSRQAIQRFALLPAALAGLLLLSLIALYITSRRPALTPPHIAAITLNGHLASDPDITERFGPLVTDGVHLFASALEGGREELSTISLPDGSIVPLPIPEEVASPSLGDISPDGSKLLLRNHLSPESEQPLWVVPTIGGSALRVGNVLAHDATFMPDGTSILFANGNELYLTHPVASKPQLYAKLPGRAFWLRWQPSGNLLRFTVIDPIRHTRSLWQLSASTQKPVRILTASTDQQTSCCGVWTSDGQTFVFQSSGSGSSDLWKLPAAATSNATRLTDGPLQFQSPVASRTGNRLYCIGLSARSELNRISKDGKPVPVKNFLAPALRVSYSRDGHWVAWTDSAGKLWRARSDGNEKLQLTPDGVDVFLSEWSPDGSHLAVMAREIGKAWQIYIIDANGGDLRRLLTEEGNAADPSWSPDAKSIVFGRVNDELGSEKADRALYILDLNSNQTRQIPGSEGLFSPRWSPDGHYIAALTLDQRQVRIFSVDSRTWSTLPLHSGAEPVWSPDSHTLYVHGRLDPTQPILRVTIPSGETQEVIRLAALDGAAAMQFVFSGITPEGDILIRLNSNTSDIYSLDLH